MIEHYFKNNTTRPFIAVGLTYLVRKILQDNFYMGRPEGWLWLENGWPSIMIAYHDCNDFYYSGHVGISTTLIYQIWGLGRKKQAVFFIFVMLNEWFMLTFLRTHYIIDLVAGLIAPLYLSGWAETVSWILDVKWYGIPAEMRDR